MNLRILGCSGGIGKDLRTSSYLIENEFLLDAGSGVGDLTLQEMQMIRHLFISHSHLDHILSIPLLVDTLFTELMSSPLQVHARPETIASIKQHIFNWQIWPDFTELPNKHSPVLEFLPMQPGEVVELAEHTIEMVDVNHTVPACGYIVSSSDRVFVYSGDTTSNNTLWERLNALPRLDFMVVETAFENREIEMARQARHYCPELLAADLQKLQHKPKICISHLKPGYEQQIFDECIETMSDDFDLCRLNSGDHFQI